MKVEEYLRQATKLLEQNSIPTARLDCLILLEYVLGTDRAKLLAEPDMKISPKQKNVLDNLLNDRARHIPIAQLVNKTEFYGRSFYIDESVLEPRPESETMIDILKSIIKTDSTLHKKYSKSIQPASIKKGSKHSQEAPVLVTICDVGCGSGALGITAKLELKNVLVELVDIDRKALKVAKNNVVLHATEIVTIESDLLRDTSTKYDVLLANLPYIPDEFKINTAATHEPKIAIFGGSDGLDVYRKLFNSLLKTHHTPLYILTEALPMDHDILADIASICRYKLVTTDDFIQVFKYIG